MNKNFTHSTDGSLVSEAKFAFSDAFNDIKDALGNVFSDFTGWLKGIWNHIKKSNSWKFTGMLTVVGLLCFVYTMITQSGTVPINGDFELEGMQFIYNGYDDWHSFFATGIFPLWDTSGLLGVDNIAANSFYYLFDPFFLVMLIFPRAILSQVQAVLMIVKLVLGGLFFYKFLGEFEISKSARKIGGMAYAFCGWGWFYLWFFHFPEVLTFFPLMLWGIEKIIRKQNPRLFIVSMVLMGATNYVFLADFTILVFIYAMYRFFQTIKTRNAMGNWSVLAIGFIAFFTGILIPCFILVPNLLINSKMPRIADANYLKNLLSTKDIKTIFGLLFSWEKAGYSNYHYLYPLSSLLFLNTNCFSEALYNHSGYDNLGSSLYVFAPLTILIIPSLLDAFKKHQWSQLIAAVLLAAALETPFVYLMLGGFANAYGRWEIFASTLIIMLVVTHIDAVKKMPGWYFDVSAIIIAVAFYLTVKTALSDASIYGDLSVLTEEQKKIIIYESIVLVACYLFMRFTHTKKTFKKEVFYIVSIEAIIMGNITITAQGVTDYKTSLFGGHENYTQQKQVVSDLNKWDTSFYRIFNSEATRSANNLSMAEGYNGVGSFNSVYNYDSENLFKYWSRISYNNSWSFGVHEKRYNLDTLLGIKYYMLGKDDTNIPYGYTDVTSLADCPTSLKNDLYDATSNPNGGFKLYKNNNFIDTAFAFDSYMSSATMDTDIDNENINEINYLKKAIIDSDYLTANADKFAGFSKEDYLSSYNRTTNVSKYETIYSANWDSAAEGGAYRTLSSGITDKAYSIEHADELEKAYTDKTKYNGYYISKDSSGVYHAEPDMFGIYPSDTINKYGSLWFNSANYGLLWNSKIALDNINSLGDPQPLLAADAASQGGAYVSIASKFGYDIDFYLYGYDTSAKTYHLLTHDMHMHNAYDKSGDWKYDRGFYVNEPVYKIVGVLHETMNSLTPITINSISYEYNTEYQADVDKLKADAIDVVSRNSNEMKYTSDYATSKIVVLNIPYSSGWTLKKTYNDSEGKEVNENVDFFLADGGLLGYIGSAGDVSYDLSYYTPGLSLGIALTSVGLTFQGGITWVWWSIGQAEKQKKQLRKSFGLKGL